MMDQASDIAAVRRVRPMVVASYLKANGWGKFDEFPGKATLWRLQKDSTGDEFEVLLPIDPALKDFGPRMAELVRTFAAAEGRSFSSVLTTLTSPADSLHVQIEREDSGDGTISLTAGARAFQGVKELLHSAAASLEEPRPFYSTRSAGAVAKFLKSARLGQTQRGSYVIAVHTPLPPRLDEPLERRVLKQLLGGVGAAREAANERTEQAFKSRVVNGVSANLCLALAKLGGGDEFLGVTLRFDWSWMLPYEPDAPSTIRFSPQTIEAIREGGEILKYVEPNKEFVLVGKVVRLEREGEAEGTVAIEGPVDSKVRRVTVVLTGADHEKAIRAYKTQELVGCVGELLRHGSIFQLIGAKRFGFVLQPEPEPEPR